MWAHPAGIQHRANASHRTSTFADVAAALPLADGLPLAHELPLTRTAPVWIANAHPAFDGSLSSQGRINVERSNGAQRGSDQRLMRETYWEIPYQGVVAARTIVLDWNISKQLSMIHRWQQRFEPMRLSAPEATRLRNLVSSLPEGVQILGALAAAEPETRSSTRRVDVDRYNLRNDVASVYLSRFPDYLLHLLDGGTSGGLALEPVPDEDPFSPQPLREWFMVPYAALLMAVVISRKPDKSRADRVDDYRFWLEHELKVSPGYEGWIGFKLLGGRGDAPAKAARLMKLGSSKDIANSIWGATWDLMYTRMPDLMALPPHRGQWPLPLVFVTDDSALVEALGGRIASLAMVNDRGLALNGSQLDLELLHDDAAAIVRPYMKRETERVLAHSRGLTASTMRRAARLARSLERQLA